nr:T9SS type A sorting domain-containing protein [uncultured Dyadobacter sp.]
MKWLIKTLTLLGIAGAMCENSAAQTIIVDFANKKVSPDGLTWTFDLVAKGSATNNPVYDGPDNDNWQAINLRLDIEVPAGVVVTGGSGVADPAHANRAGVQPAVPGAPGLNRAEVGFTVTRDSQGDVITSDFEKLATFTVTFSGAVSPANKIFPRGSLTKMGSSWTNVAGQVRRPIMVEGTQMTDVNVTLPVSLVRFDAKKEGRAVLLTWQTSDEINSERFDVERSQDGKKWETIATVKAAGESKTIRTYSATDQDPFQTENLYRLHMIDQDGTSAYSAMRNVQFEYNGVALFPNPASEYLIADANVLAKLKSIELFDGRGRRVYSSGNRPKERIIVSGFTAGVYTARILTKNGEVVNQKIVITK